MPLAFIQRIQKCLTPILILSGITACLQLQGCATWLYLNSDDKRGDCDDEEQTNCRDRDDLLLATAIMVDAMIAKTLIKEVKKQLREKPTSPPTVVDEICEAPTPNRVCTASSGCICEP